MNILIYAPFISRSRDTESFIYKLKEEGHSVFFLNQQHSDVLEKNLKAREIRYDRTNLSLGTKWRMYQNLRFLIRYCRNHRIDVVFSHLDPANSISVIAQYFLKTRFYIVRHHADDNILNGTHESLFQKLLYMLSKRIIVVSNLARQVMIENEKIEASKIQVIPPLYDFNQFEKPDSASIEELSASYPQKLKILVAGRLVKNKRPELALEVARRLKNEGIDFVMLFLGKGPMMDDLLKLIQQHQLGEHCHLLGYQTDIIPFIGFSTILLHPSLSESSSLVVKECGMNEKTVIACRGVGDFDEFIEHRKNGILTNKYSFAEEACDFLIRNYSNEDLLQSMGMNLKEAIRERYDIYGKFHLYDTYLQAYG